MRFDLERFAPPIRPKNSSHLLAICTEPGILSGMKRIDVVGQTFGRLTIIGTGRTAKGWRTAICRCSCGNRAEPLLGNVRKGLTVSCGCRLKETHAPTHGGNETPEHRSWENMHNRCNPDNKQHTACYDGVTVCPEWCGENGFKTFRDDMGKRPKNTTLDRIDGTKGYAPSNCRWATRKQQQNNLRYHRRVMFNGELRNVAEIAEALDCSYMRLWHHINKGKSVRSFEVAPR